jgi:hypothetical protein
MESIGEGESVEFDGLRRRKTVLDPNRPPTRTGTVIRTVHPPLGMSQFPTEESDSDNDSFHPGFFERLRSRGKSTSSRGSGHTPVSHGVGMRTLPPIPTDGASDQGSDVASYKQTISQDTSYKPLDPHIQFADLPDPNFHHERTGSGSSSLAPPRAPGQTAKRQFSFQNVFSRHRAESTGEASSSRRPTSKHSRKNSSRDYGNTKTAETTEEERLGLVKSDSPNLMVIPSHGSDEMGPPVYSDDWGMQRSSSPGYDTPAPSGARRVSRDFDDMSPVDLEYEKGIRQDGRFL